MKAQKVQFIFVEKDPWYKKVANGLSGRSGGNGKYGCSVHGFKTDSSKYRYSNSFMKNAKKASKAPYSSGDAGVAFSSDEPLYPNTRKPETHTPAPVRKHVNPQPRNAAPAPAPSVFSAMPEKREKPVAHMHKDSLVRTPHPIESDIASMKNKDREMAHKLADAFDGYDSSENRMTMPSVSKLGEGLREKTQGIREASANKFSAARDKFESASMDEDTFASTVRKRYESASSRLRDAKQTLVVWGTGSAVGFVVVFVTSLIIVNSNF